MDNSERAEIFNLTYDLHGARDTHLAAGAKHDDHGKQKKFAQD
jgi:hypothetical protein